MTQVEVINKMVKVFDEISYLQEDLKTIKANAKEAGMDPTMLAKVAKAISDSKVDELKEKSEATLDLIEQVRS